jgi:hypothetical protein
MRLSRERKPYSKPLNKRYRDVTPTMTVNVPRCSLIPFFQFLSCRAERAELVDGCARRREDERFSFAA